MRKQLKIWSLVLVSMVFTASLLACGDSTATAVPAAAVATTAAPVATTAPAATTAATVATTAAAIATTAPAVSGSGGTTGGTVRIYSSLPLTGSSKGQTETVVNAMKQALDDFTNGTKKIGDFTIDYVSLDDATAAKGQWDADQEKANANKAVNDPDAMAYIGTYNSGAAKIAIPILNQASMMMISPSNTLPCLSRFDANSGCDKSEPDVYYPTKTRNYFRVATNDDIAAPALANFISGNLKLKKIYLIDDSQAYGKGYADAFNSSAKNYSLEIVDRASINGKESDYKSLAATIKSKNPDGIVYGGITQQQGGKLLADIRAAGIKAPFFGADGIAEDAFIKDAGVAAEGTYVVVSGIDESKLPAKGQDFLKRYRTKFGQPEQYTIYGYESMTVVLTAIKNAAKKDRAAVVQAASAIKDFDGVLGKWSFDKNGDVDLTDFVVNIVKDGKFVFQTQTSIKK